jgi:hypothetical protein
MFLFFLFSCPLTSHILELPVPEKDILYSHFIFSGFCLVEICEPIPGISHVSTTLHFFSQ